MVKILIAMMVVAANVLISAGTAALVSLFFLSAHAPDEQDWIASLRAELQKMPMSQAVEVAQSKAFADQSHDSSEVESQKAQTEALAGVQSEGQIKALEQAVLEAEADAKRRKDKAEQQAAAQRRREEELARQAQEAEEQRRREEEQARQAQEAEEQRRREEEQARQAQEAAEAERQRRLRGQAEAAENARQAEQAANSFISIVRRAIEKAWLIPSGTSDTMSATFQVRLGSKGELVALSVAASSGDRVFDRSGILAVKRAAPFPEFQALSPDEQRNLRQFSLRFTPGSVRR